MPKKKTVEKQQQPPRRSLRTDAQIKSANAAPKKTTTVKRRSTEIQAAEPSKMVRTSHVSVFLWLYLQSASFLYAYTI